MNNAPTHWDTPTYVESDAIIRDFVARGLVILGPDQVGIDADIHASIYEKEKTAFANTTMIDATSIPEIVDVINAPGIVAACNTLVGDGWAIVPFTHNTPFVSGSNDQHWHKDDNGPFNSRKHRHHQAVQIEMLYYPQAVAEDMGPTATVPYSQYWTFNHEENHDNFAGADHLDFNYQIDGMERQPISGPKSSYERPDIVARRTKHDIRMREAVTNLGWPLVKPYEAAPLEAGSVVIYSHNLFHRGNHRRDDWHRWKTHPRFMWRFWLFRTRQPKPRPASTPPIWHEPAVDPITGVDVSDVTPATTAIWDAQYRWLTAAADPVEPRAVDINALAEDLWATGEAAEPARLGAAYQLAAAADRQRAISVLANGLHAHRENVRRASIYGLVATGEAATETLLAAVTSPVKWVRKAAAFGLGTAASVNDLVVDRLSNALHFDDSLYVRSVAADALGCLVQRSDDVRCEQLGTRVIDALIGSLEREENRLAMNLVQGRSIKFVRPTDEADVCEGIGITYNVDGYRPVRSIVRENVLGSLVIVASQPFEWPAASVATLRDVLVDVVENEANIFAAGLAMDALVRLARGDLDPRLEDLLRQVPKRSWEALIRSGVAPDRIDHWETQSTSA